MAVSEKDVILKMEHVSITFGKVAALNDVSIDVYDGEILSIIGPNGAGKTTLLNCLSGFYRPDRGSISFKGRDITHMPTHKRTQLGIARTFQGIQLYLGMTALDNILSGRHPHMRTNFLQNAFYWIWSDREETEHRVVAEEIIDFLEMEAIRDRVVGSLGYGLRKLVDLGRALALEPKVLIMDEPMAGMNVEEKEDMARFVLDIQEAKKIPVVLVEHDMEVVADISNRVAVLDWGQKIAEGGPEEIMRNPKVIKAYIGEE
jgi:branched-chain amino acid transport system ATP-binding protein